MAVERNNANKGISAEALEKLVGEVRTIKTRNLGLDGIDALFGRVSVAFPGMTPAQVKRLLGEIERQFPLMGSENKNRDE